MSGEDLYQLFVQANREQSCEIDSWDEMTDDERAAWNRTAELLPDMPSAG